MLSAMHYIIPPSLWSASMREASIRDFPALINRYKGVIYWWEKARNITESGDVNGPQMTPAEMTALTELEKRMPQIEANLSQGVGYLRDASTQAVAQGKITPQSLQGTGLEALPVLIIAAIAAAIVGLVVVAFYAIHRATEPIVAQAEGYTEAVKVYVQRYAAWSARQQGQPVPPTLPGSAPSSTATAISGIGMLAIAAVALFLFRPRRRRAA